MEVGVFFLLVVWLGRLVFFTDFIKQEDKREHDCNSCKVVSKFVVKLVNGIRQFHVEVGNVFEHSSDQDQGDDFVLFSDVDAGGLRKVIEK